MISHLKVRHAETSLRQYILKMNETLSGNVWDDMLVNLRKSNALLSLISF